MCLDCDREEDAWESAAPYVFVLLADALLASAPGSVATWPVCDSA